MADAEDSTLPVLTSLQTRLHRIEFLLAGTSPDPSSTLSSSTAPPLLARIAALSHDLKRLQAKSKTITDMLQIHSKFPELFPSTVHAPAVHTPVPLTAAEKAATILLSAPEYHATSSQLAAIQDTPVAPATASAGLVGLLPRLQRVEVVQDAQARKIAELRVRSARVLEQWFLVGIEGVNECFAEWDERTFEIDRILSQRIAAAARV